MTSERCRRDRRILRGAHLLVLIAPSVGCGRDDVRGGDAAAAVGSVAASAAPVPAASLAPGGAASLAPDAAASLAPGGAASADASAPMPSASGIDLSGGAGPISCTVAVTAPPAARVRIGRNDAVLVDGKLTLTAYDREQQLVIVTMGKKTPIVQKVYVTADGCIPDAIDATK